MQIHPTPLNIRTDAQKIVLILIDPFITYRPDNIMMMVCNPAVVLLIGFDFYLQESTRINFSINQYLIARRNLSQKLQKYLLYNPQSFTVLLQSFVVLYNPQSFIDLLQSFVVLQSPCQSFIVLSLFIVLYSPSSPLALKTSILQISQKTRLHQQLTTQRKALLKQMHCMNFLPILLSC